MRVRPGTRCRGRGRLEFRIGPGEWWATIPSRIDDKSPPAAPADKGLQPRFLDRAGGEARAVLGYPLAAVDVDAALVVPDALVVRA
ncbi:hypothetical protein ACFVFI_09645 [Streptomyces sp. NPDC057705]|uniref:hypothetical protein n=1 Tax=Streptomyces sp. NPDC057705 TaxID=3346222 RepID=UPI00367F2739